MTLTVRAVEAAKPREKPYKMADERGLYLYVSPAGGKSWRANHMRAGRQATRTYGRWPDMTLAAARKAHSAAGEGSRAESRAAPTFEAVARERLKIKLPSLSNTKHQGQVESTLERFAFPPLGERPIDAIERTELVKVVQAAQAGDLVETAHRVAGRITAVFDYAMDVGHIKGHGASGLSRVLIARKVRKPMASVPSDQAGALLRAIDSYDEPVTRLGLQLLAYTFVRVGELRSMRTSEFKEDGAIWVVPAARMKGKPDARLPHVVPMARQARAIVDELRLLTGDVDLVLDSPIRPGHALSENTFLFALYRLGYRGRMTAHGFRALASTVLNEQSGFSHDVIERQLAHKESDAVRAAYNRAEYLDARRQLMQWWADWLDAQRSPEDLPRAGA